MFRLSGKKNMTIRFLGEQWLENKKMTVKLSTYNNYKRLLNDHIFADIGDKKYTALDKQHINEYISSLMNSGRKDGKGGLSVSMTRDIIKALRAIAKYAQLEYGLKNICDGITVPKIKKPEAKTLSEGLQWKDIDFRRGCLTVSKTVQRISLGNGKTVISIDTPKTDSSARIVYIPLFIIEMLKKFRQKPDIFILSGREKPTEPRTLQHKFKKILAVCKISDISFHALRHTYATMCVEKQFDIKTLSELLGHSDVKITLNTYVHSNEKLKRKYVKRLAC